MKNTIRYIIKRTSRSLMAVLLMLTMTCSLSACGKKSSSKIVAGSSILPSPKTKSIEEVTTAANTNEIRMTGVLTYVNTSELKMHFVDTSSGTEYEVAYTGGTDIQNKYDKIIAASTMKLGGIYDVTCNKAGKAIKIYANKDVWERSGVTGLTFDESSKKINIGNTEYKYESFSTILSGAEKISIAQIVAQDEVTVRGMGTTVLSVYVDKGHGYVMLNGIDSFINGYVSVGKEQLLGVTKNMMLTVQEGSQVIELQKGSIVGSKTVNVEKNQQITVDFSEYTTAATKTGAVNFMVTPSGAIMTIDGVETDYSQPVSLTYGTHKVVISANHYEQYTETFTVNSEYQTKVIDMTASGSTTATTSAASSTKSSTSKTTAASSGNLTDGYTVSVTQPEGAALYVDSVYIGIVPCSFDKKQGSKTITLSKNGYSTVSYTISIANATGNLTYTFPDMVESSASTTATTASTDETTAAN